MQLFLMSMSVCVIKKTKNNLIVFLMLFLLGFAASVCLSVCRAGGGEDEHGRELARSEVSTNGWAGQLHPPLS